MPRRRLLTFGLGIVSLLLAFAACNDITAPGAPAAPFVPDAAKLAEATVLRVDLVAGSISSATESRSGALRSLAVTQPGSGPLRSLVGRDVIDAITSGMTRTSFDKKRDLVRFDLALVNGISGHELDAPTATPAPVAGASVFAFPYSVTVTGGSGTVTTSSDWQGTAFDFFGTAGKCNGSAACDVWESYGAPLRPGQASEARTVGFLVDKSVTAFDVYLLVSADIVTIPTGSLAVTLRSSVRGPLPAVHAEMDGTIDAVTGSDGVATFSDALVGGRVITVPAVPAGCTAPAPVTATVVESQTTALTIDVSCPPASLTISEAAFDFGGLAVGAASASHTFTITNTGGSPSTAMATAITGAQATDFVIGRDLCANALLGVGESCAVDVSLHPLAGGSRAGALTVTAVQGGAAAAALAGRGVQPALLQSDVATLNFGSLGVGSTSPAQTVTITNAGGTPSGVVTASLGGPNATEFAITSNTCQAALGNGQTCTVSISATLASTDVQIASLVVSGAPGGSVTIALAAAGVRPAQLEITPATTDFGSVVNGSTSGVQSFTVKNSGGAVSGPITFAVSGTDATQFTIDLVTTSCGPSLAGGATCTINARFAPSTPGAKSASLQATASPGGSAASAITGNGLVPATITIDRATNAFGGVVTGQSAATTFTIANVGDVPALGLTVSITGDDASLFSQTGGSCSTSIPAHTTCTVQVSFSPLTSGAKSGSVSATAAPGGTVQATLTGTGLAPAQLTISETSYDFGTLSVGQRASHDFTITNVGDAPTTSILINLLGRGPFGMFVLDWGTTCTMAPGILAPHQSCILTVTWTPRAPGPLLNASAAAAANAGGQALVTLTGTAVSP